MVSDDHGTARFDEAVCPKITGAERERTGMDLTVRTGPLIGIFHNLTGNYRNFSEDDSPVEFLGERGVVDGFIDRVRYWRM